MLARDLGVKGHILLDTMDHSFCTSFTAWPAKCFVFHSGSLVLTCGLLGFRNEEAALASWLEGNLVATTVARQVQYPR